MSRLDDYVVEAVLHDERMCREFIRRLVDTSQMRPPLETLTHDECIVVARAILDDIKARENLH